MKITSACVVLAFCVSVIPVSAQNVFNEGQLGTSDDISADSSNVEVDAADARKASTRSDDLQEITVTARRRVELLKDVPVSVAVFDTGTLEKLNITNIADTFGITPGLSLSSNGLSPGRDFQQLMIRGVGANSQLEPSVATFIDGVYAPALDFDTQYLDVERIEVLKGPQGALFGRNTEGGAVNIVLRKPDNEFRSEASMLYDNFNTAKVSGLLSGAIIEDKLFASIAIQLMQSDYFVRQTGAAVVTVDPFFPGRDLLAIDAGYARIHSSDDQRQNSGRFALRYTATDTLEFELSAHGSRFRGIGQGSGPATGCQCYTIDNELSFEQTSDSYGAAFHATKQFSGAELTAIVGDEHALSDSPQGLGPYNNFQDFTRIQDTRSLEVHLTSTSDSPFQWLTGLYGFRDHEVTSRFLILSYLNPPGLGPTAFDGLWNQQLTDITRPGFAAFAHMSYDVTSALQLAFGGRFSWERADNYGLEAFEIPANGVLPYISSVQEGWPNFTTPVFSQKSWTNFSPQFTARYKFTPDVMTYLNIASGFKAGSFQVAPVVPTDVYPINPEHTLNYEVGIKADFLEHRLAIDGSAYYVKITDQQLQASQLENGLPVSAINNASSSHVQGFDATATARLGSQVSLAANIALTDSKFDHYFATSDTTSSLINEAGHPFPNTPKWTAFVGGEYRTMPSDSSLKPLKDAVYVLGVNYRYFGDTFSGDGVSGTPANYFVGTHVPSWERLDLSLRAERDHWTLKFFVNNATNKYIVLNSFDIPFVSPTQSSSIVAAPRTFGVSLAYKN